MTDRRIFRKRRFFFSFITPLIVIVVVIILLVPLVFVLASGIQQSQSHLLFANQQNQSTPSPVPTGSSLVPNGWQVRADNLNGYSIASPSQYRVSSLSDTSGRQTNFLTNLPNQESTLFWEIYSKSSHISSLDWANQYMKASFQEYIVSDPHTFSLKSHNALYYDASIGLLGGNRYAHVVFVEKDSTHLLVLTVAGLTSPTDQLRSVFDQMLLTLDISKQLGF